MKDDNKLRCFAKTLIIIGALNWGFVGLFEFDLIATLFGEMSEILSSSQKVKPSNLKQKKFKYNFINLDQALAHLSGKSYDNMA